MNFFFQIFSHLWDCITGFNTFGLGDRKFISKIYLSGDSFALDMATTTVALGKIELQKRKEEKMPNGWGADKYGIMTNDPGTCLSGGGLLPLGGMEQTGGYKGHELKKLYAANFDQKSFFNQNFRLKFRFLTKVSIFNQNSIF